MSTLKRPRGAVFETPEALRTRLSRSWPKWVAAEIAPCDDGVGGADPVFPLTVKIGRPGLSGEALLDRVADIRAWVSDWDACTDRCNVQFQTHTRRRFGNVRLPEAVRFETIDDLSGFLGPSTRRDLERARARFADLGVIDPRLRGLAPQWRTVTELDEVEHRGVCAFLRHRMDNPEEVRSIREALIEGLDGKFLERRNAIIQDALARIDLLREGSDFRARMGFREDSRQTLWMKMHPEDMVAPFGADQFAVRPDAIGRLPEGVGQVTIVENIETFFGYAPRRGVCLMFGAGNAISGMARCMPFLADLRVVYWGDIDSFGFKILSRLRRCVPQARSVLMDEDTMDGVARPAWRQEPPEDRYVGEIDRLTDAEAAALSRVRAGGYRIEQEHLRPSARDLDRLGLALAEARPRRAG